MCLILRFASVPKNTMPYANPHQRYQKIDGPLEFRIFLALRDPERQGDGREHDHQKVKFASLSENRRTWDVRCTM